MDEGPIGWRRDASTSLTIRLLWSLGTGGFLAAIGLIVFARFAAFAVEAPLDWTVLAAIILGIGGLGLAVLVMRGRREAGDGTIQRLLPAEGTSGRVIDTVAGTAVMSVVILALAGGIGGGLGHGLAAAVIPLSFFAVAMASFLRSVGALDLEEHAIYLYEPEGVIDLETIEDVSVYSLGDVVVLRLRYGQPGGEYVPGPRWLAVPPAVGPEVAAMVRG